MYVDSFGNLSLNLVKVEYIAISFDLKMFCKLGNLIASSISLDWMYIL